MNNNLLKTLLLGFTILMFSCGDDPEGSELSTCASNQLSFTYNGQLWTPDAIRTSLSLQANNDLSGSIAASTMDNKTLTITIFNPNAPDDSCLAIGDYPGTGETNVTMEDNRFQARYSEDVSAGTLFNAFLGDLKITSCEGEKKTIEGTFSFQDATGDYIGTDGTFKVCLEED